MALAFVADLVVLAAGQGTGNVRVIRYRFVHAIPVATVLRPTLAARPTAARRPRLEPAFAACRSSAGRQSACDEGVERTLIERVGLRWL